MNEAERNSLGRALGRVTSGVFILTARHEARHAAMMASWVQQSAFDPPMISVAIARDRPIIPVIRDSGRFALSIMAEGDGALMKKYARGIAPDADPFAGTETIEIRGGVRVLAGGLAYLDCRLHKHFDLDADHELFLGVVETGRQLRDGQAFVHQRGNGFHY